ncbi:hypothetical protein MBM_08545 [Drepanopeziza brunnea f. sp. 'multigermtubi' MB_m1]|uniref:Uncharacterized protein n=1 Tax=Marssonina brunnea f. sp. multigermtubi (strain MB_m1) TaxID=1072389 RepID=K1WLJ3_MARBU|nr:uncharacterized protein MBM_08545 [Drepanopeziza brunnea f. sp. 'multigermtubi' MB_m1]EKD13102.1 hypothetical protein MBM_08545 [Drepanopeziza brunnea f. sp. 'multigermtubi' MB_m1]
MTDGTGHELREDRGGQIDKETRRPQESEERKHAHRLAPTSDSEDGADGAYFISTGGLEGARSNSRPTLSVDVATIPVYGGAESSATMVVDRATDSELAGEHSIAFTSREAAAAAADDDAVRRRRRAARPGAETTVTDSWHGVLSSPRRRTAAGRALTSRHWASIGTDRGRGNGTHGAAEELPSLRAIGEPAAAGVAARAGWVARGNADAVVEGDEFAVVPVVTVVIRPAAVAVGVGALGDVVAARLAAEVAEWSTWERERRLHLEVRKAVEFLESGNRSAS